MALKNVYTEENTSINIRKAMCIAHTGCIMQILLIGMLQGHQLPPLEILF